MIMKTEEIQTVKKLFLTSWPSGKLIVVDILGSHQTIKGGVYIRYPTGGTDTTVNDFLFEIPEGLISGE